MPTVPENDPNEAYEVINTPAKLRGPPTDWWTVTCNGVPVHHFAPERRDLAERYATEPDYRLGLTKPKAWESGRT